MTATYTIILRLCARLLNHFTEMLMCPLLIGVGTKTIAKKDVLKVVIAIAVYCT